MEKALANFDSVALKMILPATGILSLKRSHSKRPRSVRIYDVNVNTATAMVPSINGQYARENSELPTSTRVRSGSSTLLASKSLAKAGMTRKLTAKMAAAITKITMAG